MTDDAIPSVDESPRRWAAPVSWLTLVAAGWALYELTHSPALASVLICCKFGWDDVRTAGWLVARPASVARDLPASCIRPRVGKAAATAFAMSVAFQAALPPNVAPAAPGPAGNAWLGVMATFLYGLALSALLAVVAVGCAWLGGVRLWLGGGVHRARRYNFWPPTLFCLDRPNRLFLLLLPVIAVGLMAGSIAVAVLAANHAGEAVGVIAMAILAPILFFLGRRLLGRIQAATAEECWPRSGTKRQRREPRMAHERRVAPPLGGAGQLANAGGGRLGTV
ncbi:MAG: hypothetical protein U0736_27985 [Gemmataceae bacterium]